MSYQKDRDEFIGQIVSEVEAKGGTNNQGVGLARLILRNAATMQRLSEAACNAEQTPAEAKQDAACERRIKDACEPWGIVPRFQGDPRGAVVKLVLPYGRCLLTKLSF